MKHIEKKELAKKIGVENIFVNYFAESSYKTNFVIIVNQDLLVNFIGKTYTFIPLTTNGLGKCLPHKNVNQLINKITEELNNELGIKNYAKENR